MKDKYWIIYDSSKEDAFLVHKPNKIVKFGAHKSGLYTLDMADIMYNSKNEMKFINTVRENKIGYTVH